MSDPADKTAAGATRALSGSLGFILLMVGVEAVTGAAAIPTVVGIFLLILAVPCIYAAVFWEGAKRWLSVEAQNGLANLARHPVTRFGMLFLVLETVILSPFIEQHRWPFSYPSDPAVYTENVQLKAALQSAQNDAAKWRFSYNLRNGATASNGERLACKYILALSPNTGPAWHVWVALQPMLDMARWDSIPEDAQTRGLELRHGITISVGTDAGNIFLCGTSLSRVASEAFPAENVTLKINQITAPLVACKNECVELDIGD